MQERTTFTIIAQDTISVLQRLTATLSRLRLVIESLKVSRCSTPGLLEYILILDCCPGTREKILKSAARIVETQHVTAHSRKPSLAPPMPLKTDQTNKFFFSDIMSQGNQFNSDQEIKGEK